MDHVSQARVNMLHQEFDMLQFKDAELVDNFGARITDLTNQLEVLYAGYREPKIVH